MRRSVTRLCFGVASGTMSNEVPVATAPQQAPHQSPFYKRPAGGENEALRKTLERRTGTGVDSTAASKRGLQRELLWRRSGTAFAATEPRRTASAIDAALAACIERGAWEEGKAAWLEAVGSGAQAHAAGHGVGEGTIVHVFRIAQELKDVDLATQAMRTAGDLHIPTTQALVRALRLVYVAIGDSNTASALLKKLAPRPAKLRPVPSSFGELRTRRSAYGETIDWWTVVRQNGGGLQGAPASCVRT